MKFPKNHPEIFDRSLQYVFRKLLLWMGFLCLVQFKQCIHICTKKWTKVLWAELLCTWVYAATTVPRVAWKQQAVKGTNRKHWEFPLKQLGKKIFPCLLVQYCHLGGAFSCCIEHGGQTRDTFQDPPCTHDYGHRPPEHSGWDGNFW